MIKNLGFSLIELMVVIAIVSVLAAVSVPAYKNYLLKGKVNEAFAVVDAMKSQMLSYYNKNGIFPNAREISYAALGNNYELSSPTSVISAADVVIINKQTCASGQSVGEIFIRLSASNPGFPGSAGFNIFLTEANNTVNYVCFFRTDHTTNNAQTILPSNCQTSNTLAAFLAAC